MLARTGSTLRAAGRLGLAALSVAICLGCSEDVEVGTDRLGEGGACVPTPCGATAFACGDCADNDADGLIDLEDPECLGPCQNAEDSFFGSVSLQNRGRCAQDCYFDDDSGFGNDDCGWSHHCDPLSVEPDFPPEGEQCAYAVDTPLQGPSVASCADAEVAQSSTCLEVCLPLTPAGCDCFGCCALAGAPTPVWIGSNDGTNPTCTLETVADQSLCRPCTQVASCFNPGP